MMTMIKPNNISPIDQWLALNKILKTYKFIGALLGFLSFSLLILVSYLVTLPPIVVVEKAKESQSRFYYGERQITPLTEKDIADFLKDFVRLRYSWRSEKQNLVLKDIAPFMTKGLLRKTRVAFQKNITGKKPKDSIEQVAVNIKPLITEQKAQVFFDRIVRVNDVPMVAPLELEFHLIKGSPNRWNPRGLYVNGIKSK